jgi:hypothetical protein
LRTTRALRIEAVEHLPKLFEQLIQDARDAAKHIRAKTEVARELSGAVNQTAATDRSAARQQAIERARAEVVRRGLDKAPDESGARPRTGKTHAMIRRAEGLIERVEVVPVSKEQGEAAIKAFLADEAKKKGGAQ